jgi:hypothetical protein
MAGRSPGRSRQRSTTGRSTTGRSRSYRTGPYKWPQHNCIRCGLGKILQSSDPRSVSRGVGSSGGQCRLLSGGWVGRAGGGRWSGGSSAGRSALAGAGWSGGNWACRQGTGRVGAGGFRQASPIASGTGGRGPGRWCPAEIGAHVERAAVKWLAGACQSRVGGGRVDSRGVPKDVGAGGVREGVGRTGTHRAGPGRIGLQMAPGVGGRRAAVGWLGGCRAEVGMDGCRAAG